MSVAYDDVHGVATDFFGDCFLAYLAVAYTDISGNYDHDAAACFEEDSVGAHWAAWEVAKCWAGAVEAWQVEEGWVFR